MENSSTDSELLEQIRNSDAEAFRTIFDRYQPLLYRKALFQTGQSDFAHDIVQETFIRIWLHRRSLKPQLSFLAYAFRISGNIIRDEARHRKTRQKVDPVLPPTGTSELDKPDESLQHDMLGERLQEILNRKLADRCRTVFILSRFEDKSHQEIAQLLGISVRTVEHQISHALKVIRRHLSDFA